MDFLKSPPPHLVHLGHIVYHFPRLDLALRESNSPESCLEKEKDSEEKKEKKEKKKVKL